MKKVKKRVNKQSSTKLSDGAKMLDLNYGFSWRQKPICDAALEKLADELVEWSKTTSAIDIEAFFDERDLNMDCFYAYRERNKCFDEAYKLAMQRLGTKRSEGVSHFKLKETWIRTNQHRYHKAFGDSEERAAKLKEFNDDQTDRKITIVVEDSNAEPENSSGNKNNPG